MRIPYDYVLEALEQTVDELVGIDLSSHQKSNPEVPCCDFHAVATVVTKHMNAILDRQLAARAAAKYQQ